jgi:hypothetical protein
VGLWEVLEDEEGVVEAEESEKMSFGEGGRWRGFLSKV